MSIFRGAPARVASSNPTRKDTANLPSRVLATGLPLKSLTAHCTPGTPRTRVRSVSFRALVCSQYSVLGSITQTSASVTSRIWLAVRFRMLAKIEVWFSSRNVQKAIAKTKPKYLARSPVSMRRATKFMAVPLRARGGLQRRRARPEGPEGEHHHSREHAGRRRPDARPEAELGHEAGENPRADARRRYAELLVVRAPVADHGRDREQRDRKPRHEAVE